MATFSNKDDANSAPKWALSQLNKAANSSNMTAVYANAISEGIFAVDATEAASKGVHQGWIMRLVGSGGRAGRVMYETLVAFGGGIANNISDAVMAAVYISTITSPSSKSVAAPAATTFTAGATVVPNTVSATFQWQANTGAGFANLSNAGVYSNVATTVLSISDTTGLTGVSYRVLVSAAGATSLTSNAATLTVT